MNRALQFILQREAAIVDDDFVPCESCNGEGVIYTGMATTLDATVCDDCDGAGGWEPTYDG